MGHEGEGSADEKFVKYIMISALSSVSHFYFHSFQAYTMELEQEVAKLKEENEELQKKQVNFGSCRMSHTFAGRDMCFNLLA